jgi:hypothetical protein
MTTVPTNVDLAFRFAQPDPGQWLSRVDAGVTATFDHLHATRRYAEAYQLLASHLAKTEVTRRREYGPGPDWDQAVDRFACAVDRQQPAQIATISALIAAAHDPRPLSLVSGGVNVTRPPVHASGPAGAKDPTTSSAAPFRLARGPASPETTPPLTPVVGPPCGHVSDWNGMRCVRGVHPGNPGGHYYQASDGSAVADRHVDVDDEACGGVFS